jgi:DNA helicase-2/ATP-dependent DNA helicase PcrA
MHPKFGRGTVLQISGSGKNARISVQFDQTGVRELALAIAPIVRLEEET